MQHTIKPRHSLLACLMSAILPGLGQLYNGEINKAAWVLLGFAFFTIPSIALVVMYLPATWTIPTLLTSLSLTFILWLYGVIDAFQQAHRQTEYVPHAWQGIGSYLLIFALFSLVALPFLTDYVRTHLVESFRIPSRSMEPTLVPGDMLFADKRYNCPACEHKVKRGDIAIFIYPNDRNRYYIKRIIGLPGDHIQIKGKQVFINEQLISSDPVQHDSLAMVKEYYDQQKWVVVWKDDKKVPDVDIMVPNGRIFVLGDNRTESNDSRYFDTVPLRDVVGKARQIWFSFNSDLGGVVWERSGKLVE